MVRSRPPGSLSENAAMLLLILRGVVARGFFTPSVLSVSLKSFTIFRFLRSFSTANSQLDVVNISLSWWGTTIGSGQL